MNYKSSSANSEFEQLTKQTAQEPDSGQAFDLDTPFGNDAGVDQGKKDERAHIEKIWAERAVQMAHVEQEDENEGNQVTVVLLRVGRELLGLDVTHVYDIRQRETITRVPRVPSWVVGVTNLRGNILSVVDLRKYFGLPADANYDEKQNSGLLLVVQSRAGEQRNQGPAMEIIFLVDDVLSVETLPLRQVGSESGLIHRLKAEYIMGIAERKAAAEAQSGDPLTQRHIAILDADTLLSDSRLIIHEDVA